MSIDETKLEHIYDIVDMMMKYNMVDELNAIMDLCRERIGYYHGFRHMGLKYTENPRSIHVILSWLTATLPIKSKLKQRELLLNAAKGYWTEPNLFNGL